jgi:hypothetical protein
MQKLTPKQSSLSAILIEKDNTKSNENILFEMVMFKMLKFIFPHQKFDLYQKLFSVSPKAHGKVTRKSTVARKMWARAKNVGHLDIALNNISMPHSHSVSPH